MSENDMKLRTKRFALDVIGAVSLLKEADEITAIIVASRKTAGGSK